MYQQAIEGYGKNSSQFCIGVFNVTPIAFRYLFLEHRNEGHSPVMLGSLFVHQQKKFSSYHVCTISDEPVTSPKEYQSIWH